MEAQEAVSALTAADLAPQGVLQTLARLRRTFDPEQAGAIVSLGRLRLRAAAKFPHAQEMVYTEEALEQATAWPVALHRSELVHRHAPPGPVLDLGCGIGGDSLALARFRPVIAYEKDPARLACAEANVRSWRNAGEELHDLEFRNADWTADLEAGRLPFAAAAYVDPARRVDDRRIFSLHRMQPPLSELLRLQKRIANVAAKVMPGVSDAELPPACGVEFVSHEGVCKEAVLYFDDLRLHSRWASVYAHDAWHPLASGGKQAPLGSIAPGQYLYEPDPAVIRAGAFAELCDQLQSHLIDPHIAYLASDSLHDTPFAAAFQVQEVHPFHLRRLNERLQALGISQVELKKRGAPFAPESLRNRLKLPPDGSPGVVLFTRIQDAPMMIIAQRPTSSPPAEP